MYFYDITIQIIDVKDAYQGPRYDRLFSLEKRHAWMFMLISPWNSLDIVVRAKSAGRATADDSGRRSEGFNSNPSEHFEKEGTEK